MNFDDFGVPEAGILKNSDRGIKVQTRLKRRGPLLAFHMGGKSKNNFPPRVSKYGGEVKIFPPGSRNMGGKSKNFPPAAG